MRRRKSHLSGQSAKTRALEAGANALQRNSPLGPVDVYLVGFHPVKEHPEHQMSIAGSLLQARGFDVANIPGSWQACKSNGLPAEEG